MEGWEDGGHEMRCTPPCGRLHRVATIEPYYWTTFDGSVIGILAGMMCLTAWGFATLLWYPWGIGVLVTQVRVSWRGVQSHCGCTYQVWGIGDLGLCVLQ